MVFNTCTTPLGSKDKPGTYEEHADGWKHKNRIPFIGVNKNVGSTLHYNQRDKTKQQKSFGVPRAYFRFSFTSAIHNIPFAYVDWCEFTATNFYRCDFQGHISKTEWARGPNTDLLPKKLKCNPFISLDDFLPSRFALAYKTNLDVAFLALDPERIGDKLMDSGERTDLGDEVLMYKTKGTATHPNLEHYLTHHVIDSEISNPTPL